MKDIKGKTAVITGAGSGIGRSIGLALAQMGANVVIADVRLDWARSVSDEARALGVGSVPVEVDVSNRESVAALADAAWREFGDVSIVCNNAGVTWRPMRPLAQATMADWQWMLGVNLWGVIHGIHEFVPRMMLQPGEKHIVNTSSIAGLLPQGGHVPYSTTKAAVTALSEALAQELAPHGFGVTILHPSAVQTNMARSEELRPPQEHPAEQAVQPYYNPTIDAMFAESIDPAGVGRMVCSAIQRNQRYLFTHLSAQEAVRDRFSAILADFKPGLTG